MEENLNKQSKEERIIRRFSWRNIQFAILAVTFLIVALLILSQTGRTFEDRPSSEWYTSSFFLIIFTTFQWYLFFSLLTGVILMVVSATLRFPDMKKAAKKIFWKGFILTLVSLCLYFATIFIRDAFLTSPYDYYNSGYGQGGWWHVD